MKQVLPFFLNYSTLNSKRFALIFAMVLCSFIGLFAQTSWTGNAGTSWTDPGNWSAGVPDAMDTVAIFDVANDPTISAAGAVAKLITVYSGAVLTISSGATLAVNGSSTHGILNYGTVTNSGVVNIGSISSSGLYGIRNHGIFNNNTGGQININQTNFRGILILAGTFTNQATINIGSTHNIGAYGIYTMGTFNNNTGGMINIDRSFGFGVYCDTGGSFDNNASLIIGAISPISNLVSGVGIFNNNTGAVLKGTGSISAAVYNTAGGTLITGFPIGKLNFDGKENFNNGTLNLDINGKSLAGGDFDQIAVADTTTYGGTLALNINFPGATIGDEIPIIATSGFKDTFDVITGLTANWFINYRSSGIVLRYGALTETAWIGDSSTVWSDVDNWSAGIPTALSDVYINDTSVYYPVLTGVGIAKSVHVRVGGTLTIAATGTLNIEGSNDLALINAGTLDNSGVINIGASISPGFIGISNGSTFNNKPGGQIKIDRTSFFGLYNEAGTFNNESIITIGALASPGGNGLWNVGTFNNMTGGQINIDRSTDGGFLNDSLSTFTNFANITIGSNFNVGGYGFRNKGTFTNNSSGLIKIDRSANFGLYHTFSTFVNNGSILIGSLDSVGSYGINAIASFDNNAGAIINIDRCRVSGIFNAKGTFINNSSITIKSLGPLPKLISGPTGTFVNNTTGILNGSGSIAAKIFTNSGGTLSPGYSPGIMTFTSSENFSNSTIAIEVNANGTPGVNFDKIEVVDTATLGGTLALTFPYAGNPGDQIVILSASLISGTFATVTGLPVGWTLDYSPTSVTLTYITAGSTTWTGSVSVGWTTPGNWSAGVPISGSVVIIPDVPNFDPTISTTVSVKSLTIDASASLTIIPGGTLNIDGAAAQGLLNNGTIANGGTINIGSTLNVGAYGLRNNSIFNNNGGGQLNINKSTNTGLENTGTFTNLATINIGNIAGVGLNGILNTSIFNNNVGGQINIDRSADAGLYNNTGGTFSNLATLSIGAGFGVGEYGIWNKATFNSNGGSQLTINRSTDAAIENLGTFTNLTTINLGTIASIGTYGVRNYLTFNNNAGSAINVDRSTDAAINNEVGGTFNNLTSIVVGANQNIGQYGVWNSAIFNNSGSITVNRSSVYGLWNYLGTFTNTSAINIGNAQTVGQFGLYNNAIFNNNAGGAITIDRSSEAGLYNYGTGNFINLATVNIGGTIGVGNYGIRNLSMFNNNAGTMTVNGSANSGIYNDNGTFTNIAAINIGSTSGVGSYGLRNRNVFNNTGGLITINRSTVSGILIEAGDISNTAGVTVGNLVAMTDLITGVSGNFANNTGGVFKGTGKVQTVYFSFGGGTIAPGYSPGIMTFTGNTNFGNNIMNIEVNGKTTAGTDFDRVVVVGTATLGGTLKVINNFPGALVGDQVTILTATAVSGTFPTIIGLPANWSISYTATSVILTLGPTLPVELLTFKARLQNDKVFLDWKTASETNNKGFNIERSVDGKTWNTIGFVAGNGTTTKVQTYAFTDATLIQSGLLSIGVAYYRLRQVDFNGKEDLSKVESVDITSLNRLSNMVHIFPNPVSGKLMNIVMNTSLIEEVTIQLYSPAGALIGSKVLAPGKNEMDVTGLSAGLYIVKISGKQSSIMEKVIIVY